MLLTAPLETFITVAFLIAAFVDVKTAVRAFNWMSGVWPSGFRHYVANREVRPSPEPDRFVREWAQGAAQPKV
jgi:hypothetical protein